MNGFCTKATPGLLLSLLSAAAFAAATTQTVSGEVLVSTGSGDYEALAFGQRIESGATIKTGADGRVVLRFDDGQMLYLTESSLLVVSEYKFDAHNPADSKFQASLLKGSLRAVTGVIGEANKKNVTFKTPVATVGITGTDFQLVMGNALYINVISGIVVASNDAGSMMFDAKGRPNGQVLNAKTRPAAAAPGVLPSAVQGVFRRQKQQPLMGPIMDPNPKDPACEGH